MAVYGPVGSEELYRYGVLGMKWGVRHDRKKAYEKASGQAKKNREKYDDAKNAEQATAYKISQRRMSRLKMLRDTSDLEAKLEGQNAAVIRRAKRGADWYKSMKEEFSKVEMKISEDQEKELKMYLKELDLFNERIVTERERRRK